MEKQEKKLCSRVKSDEKGKKRILKKKQIYFRGFGIYLQAKKRES
jgi:hypothetical protein